MIKVIILTQDGEKVGAGFFIPYTRALFTQTCLKQDQTYLLKDAEALLTVKVFRILKASRVTREPIYCCLTSVLKEREIILT